MDTFTTEKTIRMPGEIADKWLAALRSGEYKQGTNVLCNYVDSVHSYCCLGVLQMVVDGDVERDRYGAAEGLPSYEWTDKHGIETLKTLDNNATNESCGFCPVIARTDTGFYKLITVAHANDVNNWNFKHIADHLDHCIERI